MELQVLKATIDLAAAQRSGESIEWLPFHHVLQAFRDICHQLKISKDLEGRCYKILLLMDAESEQKYTWWERVANINKYLHQISNNSKKDTHDRSHLHSSLFSPGDSGKFQERTAYPLMSTQLKYPNAHSVMRLVPDHRNFQQPPATTSTSDPSLLYEGAELSMLLNKRDMRQVVLDEHRSGYSRSQTLHASHESRPASARNVNNNELGRHSLLSPGTTQILRVTNLLPTTPATPHATSHHHTNGAMSTAGTLHANDLNYSLQYGQLSSSKHPTNVSGASDMTGSPIDFLANKLQAMETETKNTRNLIAQLAYRKQQSGTGNTPRKASIPGTADELKSTNGNSNASSPQSAKRRIHFEDEVGTEEGNLSAFPLGHRYDPLLPHLTSPDWTPLRPPDISIAEQKAAIHTFEQSSMGSGQRGAESPEASDRQPESSSQKEEQQVRSFAHDTLQTSPGNAVEQYSQQLRQSAVMSKYRNQMASHNDPSQSRTGNELPQAKKSAWQELLGDEEDKDVVSESPYRSSRDRRSLSPSFRSGVGHEPTKSQQKQQQRSRSLSPSSASVPSAFSSLTSPASGKFSKGNDPQYANQMSYALSSLRQRVQRYSKGQSNVSESGIDGKRSDTDDSTQQAVASSRGQPADRGTDADVLIAKWSQELIPHTHEGLSSSPSSTNLINEGGGDLMEATAAAVTTMKLYLLLQRWLYHRTNPDALEQHSSSPVSSPQRRRRLYMGRRPPPLHEHGHGDDIYPRFPALLLYTHLTRLPDFSLSNLFGRESWLREKAVFFSRNQSLLAVFHHWSASAGVASHAREFYQRSRLRKGFEMLLEFQTRARWKRKNALQSYALRRLHVSVRHMHKASGAVSLRQRGSRDVGLRRRQILSGDHLTGDYEGEEGPRNDVSLHADDLASSSNRPLFATSLSVRALLHQAQYALHTLLQPDRRVLEPSNTLNPSTSPTKVLNADDGYEKDYSYASFHHHMSQITTIGDLKTADYLAAQDLVAQMFAFRRFYKRTLQRKRRLTVLLKRRAKERRQAFLAWRHSLHLRRCYHSDMAPQIVATYDRVMQLRVRRAFLWLREHVTVNREVRQFLGQVKQRFLQKDAYLKAVHLVLHPLYVRTFVAWKEAYTQNGLSLESLHQSEEHLRRQRLGSGLRRLGFWARRRRLQRDALFASTHRSQASSRSDSSSGLQDLFQSVVRSANASDTLIRSVQRQTEQSQQHGVPLDRRMNYRKRGKGTGFHARGLVQAVTALKRLRGRKDSEDIRRETLNRDVQRDNIPAESMEEMTEDTAFAEHAYCEMTRDDTALLWSLSDIRRSLRKWWMFSRRKRLCTSLLEVKFLHTFAYATDRQSSGSASAYTTTSNGMNNAQWYQLTRKISCAIPLSAAERLQFHRQYLEDHTNTQRNRGKTNMDRAHGQQHSVQLWREKQYLLVFRDHGPTHPPLTLTSFAATIHDTSVEVPPLQLRLLCFPASAFHTSLALQDAAFAYFQPASKHGARLDFFAPPSPRPSISLPSTPRPPSMVAMSMLGSESNRSNTAAGRGPSGSALLQLMGARLAQLYLMNDRMKNNVGSARNIHSRGGTQQAAHHLDPHHQPSAGHYLAALVHPTLANSTSHSSAYHGGDEDNASKHIAHLATLSSSFNASLQLQRAIRCWHIYRLHHRAHRLRHQLLHKIQAKYLTSFVLTQWRQLLLATQQHRRNAAHRMFARFGLQRHLAQAIQSSRDKVYLRTVHRTMQTWHQRAQQLHYARSHLPPSFYNNVLDHVWTQVHDPLRVIQQLHPSGKTPSSKHTQQHQHAHSHRPSLSGGVLHVSTPTASSVHMVDLPVKEGRARALLHFLTHSETHVPYLLRHWLQTHPTYRLPPAMSTSSSLRMQGTSSQLHQSDVSSASTPQQHQDNARLLQRLVLDEEGSRGANSGNKATHNNQRKLVTCLATSLATAYALHRLIRRWYRRSAHTHKTQHILSSVYRTHLSHAITVLKQHAYDGHRRNQVRHLLRQRWFLHWKYALIHRKLYAHKLARHTLLAWNVTYKRAILTRVWQKAWGERMTRAWARLRQHQLSFNQRIHAVQTKVIRRRALQMTWRTWLIHLRMKQWHEKTMRRKYCHRWMMRIALRMRSRRQLHLLGVWHYLAQPLVHWRRLTDSSLRQGTSWKLGRWWHAQILQRRGLLAWRHMMLRHRNHPTLTPATTSAMDTQGISAFSPGASSPRVDAATSAQDAWALHQMSQRSLEGLHDRVDQLRRRQQRTLDYLFALSGKQTSSTPHSARPEHRSGLHINTHVHDREDRVGVRHSLPATSPLLHTLRSLQHHHSLGSLTPSSAGALRLSIQDGAMSSGRATRGGGGMHRKSSELMWLDASRSPLSPHRQTQMQRLSPSPPSRSSMKKLRDDHLRSGSYSSEDHAAPERSKSTEEFDEDERSKGKRSASRVSYDDRVFEDFGREYREPQHRSDHASDATTTVQHQHQRGGSTSAPPSIPMRSASKTESSSTARDSGFSLSSSRAHATEDADTHQNLHLREDAPSNSPHQRTRSNSGGTPRQLPPQPVHPPQRDHEEVPPPESRHVSYFDDSDEDEDEDESRPSHRAQRQDSLQYSRGSMPPTVEATRTRRDSADFEGMEAMRGRLSIDVLDDDDYYDAGQAGGSGRHSRSHHRDSVSPLEERSRADRYSSRSRSAPPTVHRTPVHASPSAFGRYADDSDLIRRGRSREETDPSRSASRLTVASLSHTTSTPSFLHPQRGHRSPAHAASASVTASARLHTPKASATPREVLEQRREALQRQQQQRLTNSSRRSSPMPDQTRDLSPPRRSPHPPRQSHQSIEDYLAQPHSALHTAISTTTLTTRQQRLFLQHQDRYYHLQRLFFRRWRRHFVHSRVHPLVAHYHLLVGGAQRALRTWRRQHLQKRYRGVTEVRAGRQGVLRRWLATVNRHRSTRALYQWTADYHLLRSLQRAIRHLRLVAQVRHRLRRLDSHAEDSHRRRRLYLAWELCRASWSHVSLKAATDHPQSGVEEGKDMGSSHLPANMRPFDASSSELASRAKAHRMKKKDKQDVESDESFAMFHRIKQLMDAHQ